MKVYRHIRLDTNEVFYIGISSDNKRPYSSRSRNRFWKNVVSKTDYIVEIIACNLTQEESYELEEFLISEYGRRDLGTGCLVNLTNGGESSCVGEDNAMYGLTGENHPAFGYRHTEEAKLKISKSRMGNKNPMFGHSFSKTHRDRLSKSQKKVVKTREWRQKIGNAHLGGKSPHAKQVIDLETGFVFDAIIEACRSLNINYNTTKTRMRKNSSRIVFV